MKTTTVTQKCKNCDGELVFDAANKSLVCQKCGYTSTVYNNVTSAEKSFQGLLLRAPVWQKEAAVYCCDQCGAKTVITKHDFSVVCDYCGAKSVKTNEIPGLRPDTVVLFGINQEEAAKSAKEWLENRAFVPGDFKRAFKKRQLKGVYLPAFSFDARISTNYSAIGVISKELTKKINGRYLTESQVLRRPIEGTDDHIIDDLLVLANEDFTPEILKQIEPFDAEHGQVFKQEYLAGFNVAQSTKEPMQTWEEAKKIISSVIENKIITKYSGIKIENIKMEINISNIMYKYVLLPVYVGNTEYKNKKYELLINGQTGKVYGKAPKSPWKVFRFFASAFLLVGAAIVLAMFL